MKDDGSFNTEDFDCTWLELFHPTAEDTKEARADIIFVPGLGGDYIETWKASDKTVWPRDLLPLPDNIPDVRVVSFRYNTSLNGTTSQAGIRDHANDLLARLFDDREDDEAASLRPLVFVGHSLGGIVIKRALVEMAVKERYQDLWDSSRGVMFFATPHFGLSKENWQQFAYKVLLRNAPSEGVKPTENMLKDLRVNSKMLKDISEDFKPLQPDLSFVTFIENTPLDGMEEVLVDDVYGFTHAATESRLKLSGDHIGICKFRSHEDDQGEFGLVKERIEALINGEPQMIHRLAYQERRALYSLCPVSFHRHGRDRKPTEGTCGWIFNVPQVKKWLASEPGKERLWIHGKPGCGKSFLAQHLITKLREGTTLDKNGVIHCFLSDSHPSRGNLQALLRATLHQALRLVPELVGKFLLRHFEDAEQQRSEDQDIWTRDILLSVWADAMAEVVARRPLTFVVDGLDEMKMDCQKVFFDCLDRLPNKTREVFEKLEKEESDMDLPTLRFLVLSRDEAHIGAGLSQLGFKSYGIQVNDTQEDIRRTVSAGLSSFWGSRRGGTSRLEGICSRIADDSNGSYLWATLVVEELTRTRKTSREQILSALDGYLPSDVDKLYAHTLLELNNTPKSGAFVKQVLQWAVFQQEGLKVAELQIADALAKTTTRHPNQAITPGTLARCRDDNIKARIDFHCGHLVKFQDGRLTLTHRTLKRYLSTQTSADRSSSELFLNPETCHATLANLCMAYLTMPVFSDWGPQQGYTIPTSSWESKVRRRVKDYPFVRYAALYWYKHLAAAGPAWPTPEIILPSSTNQELFMYNPSPSSREDQLRRKSLLEDDKSEYARCWTEVWWFFVRGIAERDKGKGPLEGPEGFSKLSPARVAGLPRPIDVPLPEDQDQDGRVELEEEQSGEEWGEEKDKDGDDGRSSDDGKDGHGGSELGGEREILAEADELGSEVKIPGRAYKGRKKKKQSDEGTRERVVYVEREVEKVVYVDRPVDRPVVVVEKEVVEPPIQETESVPVTQAHVIQTEAPVENVIQRVVEKIVFKEPEKAPKKPEPSLTYLQRVWKAGKVFVKTVGQLDTPKPPEDEVVESVTDSAGPRAQHRGGSHLRASPKRRRR